MKILFFIRSLVVGGSQRQLLLLADGLARRGHDVAVAVFYTGGEIDGARQATRVRVLPLGKAGRWHVMKPVIRLRRLLRSERPDILYAFQPTQTVLAALVLPHGLPTRLIFAVRAAAIDTSRYDALSALTIRLEARLARRADFVIANSHAGCDDAVLRGMSRDRIAVVPNGIDSVSMAPDAEAGRAQRRTWGIADDAFVVGCVARFDPMKDHTTFLRGAELFLREHSDARFVCVGYGPVDYLEQLKAKARNLGLAEHIVWSGAMADMHAAYNAFDIATLSSSFGEGFPNVVGEAMACGSPVAATDVGDVRQIIGGLGEVVPPRQPEALCAAWERLRRRLEQEPGLQAAARAAIVANYSVEGMVQRTEAFFSLLLANRPVTEIARGFA